MQARLLAATALALALGGPAPSARSAATPYTTHAAFAAATAGLATTADADFEGLADLTVVPSGTALGGVTFGYSIGDGSVQMIVVADFPTTSGTNSLGTAGDLTFLAGDAFTIAFPPSTAVGLYVIGEDMLPGDVVLQTPVGDVPTGAVEQTLSDGSSAFFVGIVESDPQLAFGTATITSVEVEAPGDFVWNVDDVTAAPEPAASAGGVVAALALAVGTALAAPKSRCTRSASTFRRARAPRSRESRPPWGSSARP